MPLFERRFWRENGRQHEASPWHGGNWFLVGRESGGQTHGDDALLLGREEGSRFSSIANVVEGFLRAAGGGSEVALRSSVDVSV